MMEMARCTMHSRNLSSMFWAEVVATVVYILNRVPTHAAHVMTLKEKWIDRKPAIGHLKTFGCIAYAPILEENCKKLDRKSLKCIFVGYSDQNKTYRLWDPQERKIVINQDVKFDESSTYHAKQSSEEHFYPPLFIFPISTTEEDDEPVAMIQEEARPSTEGKSEESSHAKVPTTLSPSIPL